MRKPLYINGAAREVSDSHKLEELVTAAIGLLQYDIREMTGFLVQQQDEREKPEWHLAGSWQQEVTRRHHWQRLIDQYERWLVRTRTHVPIEDQTFQKIAWLCGVAHDILPDMMQLSKEQCREIAESDIEDDEKEELERVRQQRLLYEEELYLQIHAFVMSLRSGNS